MSIQITLTPEEERKLAGLARARGKEPSDHVHDLISAYLIGADRGGPKSFEEILGPIWEGWHRSGMTDGEIDELLEEEVRAARTERRRVKGTK